MYIPLKPILKKYKIPTKGILHIGGHWGEEYDEYISCGINKMIWVEPCKEAFDIMQAKSEKVWKNKNVTLINVACGAEETELTMNISKQNQGQSNSFLKSFLHSVQHPEILFTETETMKVVTLDSIPFDRSEYNMMAIDVEGFEGEVLKGAEETLKHIDLLYLEVNKAATRIGNILIDELEEYLWQRDFVMIEVYWPSPNFTWGDSIAIRKSFIHA